MKKRMLTEDREKTVTIQRWEEKQEKEALKLDYSKISNIVLEDINLLDTPDFCDAFIAEADYERRPMTEEELEIINDDSDFVYQAIMNYLY